jgi:hypothetical protein
MKNLIIPILLFSINALAVQRRACSEKTVQIKMPGFSGYGEELKKTKQIAQLVRPSKEQISSFDKSFEIGKYRFVRNDQAWDIYRKNEMGEYEKKVVQGKFQVDADQKIWATVRSDGSINIHRNVSGDDYQKEMNIFFTNKEIYILDSNRNKLFSYENCEPSKQSSLNSSPNKQNSAQGQK